MLKSAPLSDPFLIPDRKTKPALVTTFTIFLLGFTVLSDSSEDDDLGFFLQTDYVQTRSDKVSFSFFGYRITELFRIVERESNSDGVFFVSKW